ncbi:MAG: type III pantothenate kinase [Spirochaetia bacterium]|nr:type III pantothenate kinase [Spirochaetia bacterium]
MLLALDLSNGMLVCGFRHDGHWLASSRLGSDRTADEYAFFLEAAASRAGLDQTGRVETAWLSSVVPTMTPRVVRAVRLAFGIETALVAPGVKTGIKIRTDVPTEVGSDIVCAAVAARNLKEGPVIVVDFGTVIAISALNGAGELLGVSIAPGLDLSMAAIKTGAAQIPEVRLDLPKHAIGRTTVQAVQSGVMLGFGGLIQRLIDLMSAEMACSPAVIGCGDEEGHGLMTSLGHELFVPELVLDGLSLIAGRNPQAFG